MNGIRQLPELEDGHPIMQVIDALGMHLDDVSVGFDASRPAKPRLGSVVPVKLV